MQKIWRPRAECDIPTFLAQWADKLSVSPRLAGLLWQRGQRSLEAMDAFLCPGLRHLMRPEEIPGLTDAARALADVLTRGETLAVWGDYDVDGVTASAVVVDFLRRRGYAARPYIPARLEEGYGLNRQGLERLREEGVHAVLTVDCGISATAEALRATELGLTLIISDHHLPGPELPQARAVVNPKLAEGPGVDLAGVGVAFFLMAALNKLLPGDPIDIRPFLDLVALGTLADVVSLSGPNRILVKNGLLVIAEAPRPGILALKEASGYAARARLEASQVVFGLAPRINAAGRLGRADEALALLLAPGLDSARPLAEMLNDLNIKRRAEEDAIVTEAMEQALPQAQSPGIVLYAPHWHQGVIGIVASRVVEAHYRPTLILTEEQGRIKGSGRSISEFDLHAALTACASLLSSFGGHRQAAGLSLAHDNLEGLRLRFPQAVTDQLGPEMPLPSLKLDGELPFGDIHQAFLKELDLLGPFGCGNPEPVFTSGPVTVRSRRAFGANHVSLDVRDDTAGVTLRAKAWRQADALGPDIQGKTLRLAFTPKLDTYNGLASVELRLKDWKTVPPGTAAG